MRLNDDLMAVLMCMINTVEATYREPQEAAAIYRVLPIRLRQQWDLHHFLNELRLLDLGGFVQPLPGLTSRSQPRYAFTPKAKITCDRYVPA